MSFLDKIVVALVGTTTVGVLVDFFIEGVILNRPPGFIAVGCLLGGALALPIMALQAWCDR